MLRTWLEPEYIPVPENFVRAIGGHPLVSRMLYKRGLTDVDTAIGFLHPDRYHPTPGTYLPGMEKAAELIRNAILQKKRIGVWGDFDVDGQTATTVLVSALQSLGGNVLFHIPIRAAESHGIGIQALKTFLARKVDLLLTCDTGITSHEAIAYAQDHAIPVVLTDHHDLPQVLPDAEVILNPKMLPVEHPLSSLPGVGVAYKLVEYLYQLDGQPEYSDQYLDLVALGIVADIALQKDDTRYLLQRGLRVLRTTKRLGLLTMMELAEINPANLTEEHIGFFLAPRMNALGRLDDANQMVELLTTSDPGRARLLAVELEGMNAQRKLLTDQVFQAAEATLSRDPSLLDSAVLVLSNPSWPAGIIGIVASRLVEKYHRPTILLSSPPGMLAHGSARSIESVNITSAISSNSNLVQTFGGHPMAAGLSMDPELIPDFRAALSQTVQSMGAPLQLEKNLPIDGYFTLPELSLELVEDLERLAPFGAGNPPLVLATRNLKLSGYAAVGRTDEHLQLTVEDEMAYSRRSIWWQGAGNALPDSTFDLAYSVRASTYRGQRDVQVEWLDYRISNAEQISLSKTERQPEVIDLRKEPDPMGRLAQITKEENVVIWGEGIVQTDFAAQDRLSIAPSSTLVVWTIPPGPSELRIVLQKVKPERVYLFAIDPGMDSTEKFLQRLLGLLKFKVNKAGGRANLSALAAACSQTMPAIKAGIDFLDSQGLIKLISSANDLIYVDVGPEVNIKLGAQISAQLSSALHESSAYRRYYRQASKDGLVFLE